MNRKLTLTIEQEIIEIAKKYAQEKGQSLSEIVENYFKLITTDRRKIKSESLSPRVKKLRGVIDLQGRDYRSMVAEEITKKYDL